MAKLNGGDPADKKDPVYSVVRVDPSDPKNWTLLKADVSAKTQEKAMDKMAERMKDDDELALGAFLAGSLRFKTFKARTTRVVDGETKTLADLQAAVPRSHTE